MVELVETTILEGTVPLAIDGLKVVILAAGKDAITAGGQALMLQTLGERAFSLLGLRGHDDLNPESAGGLQEIGRPVGGRGQHQQHAGGGAPSKQFSWHVPLSWSRCRIR